MKVIFIKDLKGQGKKDQIKEEKDGYAINFLIKNGYAVAYNESNIKKIDNEHKQKEKQEIEEINKNTKIKEELENKILTFKVKTGEKDRVFGSISSKQISNQLQKMGYNIDKKQIHLEEPLSSLGFHNVKVELHKKVILELKVELVRE